MSTRPEMHDRAMKMWDEAGPYNKHLILLHEWNEETSFMPITSMTMQTDMGVMVIQEIMQRNREFYPNGEFKDLGPPTVFQLCAVYGDDEQLFRLVCFDNGYEHDNPKSRHHTQVLVNSGPMRS